MDGEALERLERQIGQLTQLIESDRRDRRKRERETTGRLGILINLASFQELKTTVIFGTLGVCVVGAFWAHATLRDTIAAEAPGWMLALFPHFEQRRLVMQEENSFEAALAFVLNEEGGYANHPADKGGRTNFGVTQDWLNKHGVTAGIAATEVENLTRADAEKAYRLIYDSANCGAYAPPMSVACLDTAVNFGVSGWGLFLRETGVSGARPKKDAIAIAEARQEYRHERVAKAPSQEVFLEGWLNRDDRLLTYAKTYQRTTGNGGRVAAQAESWVGKEFKPGHKYQCSYFVRHVLVEAGLSVPVTTKPLDGMTSGPGFASSFYGHDVGDLITNPDNLEPGDLVLFAQTYGNWGPDVITHVGVYIGNGMMVDRPTSDRPVQKRSIDTFPHFKGGIRPYAYKSRLAED